MKSFLTILVLALVFAASTHAQGGVAGKWEGRTNGGADIVLDFTVKGAELTGTLTRNDEKAPIEKGKVAKNTITFSATLGGQPESLTGELKDDVLTVWLDRQSRDQAVVFKRAKK